MQEADTELREQAQGRPSATRPLLWTTVAVAVAVGACLGGVQLLGFGPLQPALSSDPVLPEAQNPVEGPAPAPLAPGQAASGALGEEGVDEWEFEGQAGQFATVEMWLRPTSSSSVEDELALILIGPQGEELATETGSVYLPPYLVEYRLPADGRYRLRVVPLVGAPGQYSLFLTLTDEALLTQRGTVTDTAGTGGRSGFGGGSGASGFEPVPEAWGIFQWPTLGRHISGWYFRDPGKPSHIGLDIGVDMRDPIYAAADGVVTYTEWGGGYGNLVVVDHANGWQSFYAHLTEINVELEQIVSQGDTLGAAGSTGYSTGPHLHFELRYQGRPVDPLIYLP